MHGVPNRAFAVHLFTRQFNSRDAQRPTCCALSCETRDAKREVRGRNDYPFGIVERLHGDRGLRNFAVYPYLDQRSFFGFLGSHPSQSDNRSPADICCFRRDSSKRLHGSSPRFVRTWPCLRTVARCYMSKLIRREVI